jgi:pyridoxamine 5'-phosphate oxidase
MTGTAPDRLDTLAEIHAALWRELGRAALDRHHEWRTPVLATVAADGLPDARTVVIREVQAAARRLVVYTDARAGKVAQLVAQPAAMLVLWSRRLGWQLRLRLHAEVLSDGLAVTSRWASLRATPAARDYLSPLAPGAALPTDGGPQPAEDRAHFALLDATVQRIDWLELHRDGHRRAVFEAASPGVWVNP